MNQATSVTQTTLPPAVLMAGGNALRSQNGQKVGTQGASFAEELAGAQSVQAPVSLLPPQKEKAAEAQGESFPEISRSARMDGAKEATKVVEAESPEFGDLVDLLNPLQHIPVVGSIYRALTGDEIKPEVKVAGGFLLGAATGGIMLGAAAAVANAVFEQANGKEPVIEVAQNIFGGPESGPANLEDKTIDVAQAVSAPVPTAVPTQPVERAETVSVTPVTMQAQAAQPATTTTQVAAATHHALPLAAGSQRVGNVIYTSPQLKNAARIATATKTETPAPVVQGTKSSLDSQTLGTMLHEQAKSREGGATLPPELVQDMMLMALDKYKAAQANMGGNTALP